MSRIVIRRVFAAFCCVSMVGLVFAQDEKSAAPSELRLGDCTIYVESSRVLFLARKGTEWYAGSLAAVVRCVSADATGHGTDGTFRLKLTEGGTREVGVITVTCGTGSQVFTQMGEASWAQLPRGKDTTVPICPGAGKDKCPPNLLLPCGETLASTAASTAVVATTTANQVQLMDGEVVAADQIHVILRSELIEEGDGVALMSRLAENINTARRNFNTYRVGYLIASEKVGDRYQFSGDTRGFRATAPGQVSSWPPFIYPASRREAMRRAKALEPILPQVECPEMKNLRVYVYAMNMGHDGNDYVTEPTAFAFFVDPKTGNRMTVFFRKNRSYGAVAPSALNITGRMYVHEVSSFSAGPFGIATAYSPSVFYSREVRVEHQPFAERDVLDQYMAAALAARGKLMPNDQFVALAREMARYTGGGTF